MDRTDVERSNGSTETQSMNTDDLIKQMVQAMPKHESGLAFPREMLVQSILPIILPVLDENIKLKTALKPFADCCEQIDCTEDDEEWAKFRLLVSDYRRARNAMNGS